MPSCFMGQSLDQYVAQGMASRSDTMPCGVFMAAFRRPLFCRSLGEVASPQSLSSVPSKVVSRVVCFFGWW